MGFHPELQWYPAPFGEAFGFRVAAIRPGPQRGDRCTVVGVICSDDATVCLDFGGRGVGRSSNVRRRGFAGDCGAGTSYRTSIFGDEAPDFTGVRVPHN